jgi:hypothetical protein
MSDIVSVSDGIYTMLSVNGNYPITVKPRYKDHVI